jgi:hypothetical protein
VLDGSLNGSEPEWSQVRQLFEQEKVEEFSISSDSVLTMKLRDAAEGSEIMRYQLYDFQMFYDELNDLVLEQTAKGIITGYDYPDPQRPSLLEILLPYALMLGAVIAFLYFMVLRPQGGGGGDRMAKFGTANIRTLSDKDKVRATLALSRMSGWNGMIAGQIIDLAGEKKALGYNTLIKLHTLKTGCLIRCAAMLGCIAANVPDDDERYTDAISYAEKIGLAFQIIDDVLDKIGDASILGKTVGKDENSQKTTFLSFMSVNDAIEMAKRLTNEAISVIQKYDNSDLLIELANYLLTRNR